MEQQTRVAIVTPVYPPYRGGIGTVAAHDAEQLREHGCTVEIFTPAYKKQSAKEASITRLQPFYSWGNGAVLLDLLFALKGFDVVHLHYPFFGSDILAAFACRLWNIPFVVTYHMKPKARGILGATFFVYRTILQPFIFSAAHSVLVSSDDYADAQNVKHRNRRVLPFGVDVKRFTPGDRVAARLHFGLTNERPVIIFVGGLDAAHYFKGLDVLLRAFAMMKTYAQLLIIGDGNCRADFEQIAAGLGIAGRVRFAGSIASESLPLAYQSADVHVLPSIDRSEAFGIVTEEAMATGIPSIVSDLPGVRTLVIEEKTGLRVLPGDASKLVEALDRLCGDLEFRVNCGKNARKFAEENFSDSVLSHRLLEIYAAARRSS
ncbi:MAG: glycosyltransferase family 4 protein [Patescibacteria group bacterium]|jgi:glycosyltransferase involved in cell wall biosynthesis